MKYETKKKNFYFSLSVRQLNKHKMEEAVGTQINISNNSAAAAFPRILFIFLSNIFKHLNIFDDEADNFHCSTFFEFYL